MQRQRHKGTVGKYNGELQHLAPGDVLVVEHQLGEQDRQSQDRKRNSCRQKDLSEQIERKLALKSVHHDARRHNIEHDVGHFFGSFLGDDLKLSASVADTDENKQHQYLLRDQDKVVKKHTIPLFVFFTS